MAQVSGVGTNSLLKSTSENESQSGNETKTDPSNIWQEFGVRHDTLDDARRFARRRYDYYKTNNSGAQVRVVSSLGYVHPIYEISDGEKFWFELAGFFRWLKRKVCSIFR